MRNRGQNLLQWRVVAFNTHTHSIPMCRSIFRYQMERYTPGRTIKSAQCCRELVPHCKKKEMLQKKKIKRKHTMRERDWIEKKEQKGTRIPLSENMRRWKKQHLFLCAGAPAADLKHRYKQQFAHSVLLPEHAEKRGKGRITGYISIIWCAMRNIKRRTAFPLKYASLFMWIIFSGAPKKFRYIQLGEAAWRKCRAPFKKLCHPFCSSEDIFQNPVLPVRFFSAKGRALWKGAAAYDNSVHGAH